jgi:metallo-beta-lactamase family protein
MESTYGGRFHKNTGDHVEEFARVIQETLDKGGNVVIPAFAVGRTQEVLNYIRIIKEKNLVTGHGVFPVYLDSPMAVEATGVFKDNMMDCYNEETKELVKKGINPISFPGLHPVRSLPDAPDPFRYQCSCAPARCSCRDRRC